MAALTHWLSDLSGYLKLGVRKGIYPLTQSGENYFDSKYDNQAKRAVERLHPKRMRLRLAEILQETTDTKTFRFERMDGNLPPFRGGQYVNLFCEIQGVITSRPYSISSLPESSMMDLTIRKKPGGFVSSYLLDKAKVGDEMTSTGPVGSFCYEPLIDGDELIFLAGGSGITPFMSIIRQQEKLGWPLKIHLLYGSRKLKDVIFGDELNKLSKGNDRFKYTPVISEPTKSYKGEKGFLSAKLIQKLVGDISNKPVLMCGPNVMYDFCLSELEQLGIKQHKIRRELYGPPEDVTVMPGWPEKLKASKTFTVEVEGKAPFEAKAGEPLINALERQGVVVPAVCRSGECSACRTKIISGKVFMPAYTGIRESDVKLGYVHACVSYPISNLKIRL